MSARDRLIRALIATPDEQRRSLNLVRDNEEYALVSAPGSKRRIYVVTSEPGAPPGQLQARLQPLVGQSNRVFGPETYFLILGPGDEARAAVTALTPRLLVAELGYYHVDPEGHLTHIAGPQLPKRAMIEQSFAFADLSEVQSSASAPAAEPVDPPLERRSTVTTVITVVCAILMLLAYFWGGASVRVLYRMGAANNAAILRGEIYRLFSAAFLHGDIVHVTFNMVALWSFGTFLEGLLGRSRYILLYAGSALGGSLLSLALSDWHVSVGASGAIWGLMTAGFGIAFRPQGVFSQKTAESLRRSAYYPLAINALYSLRPGIDWQAHLGGGIVGFLLAAFVLNRGLVPIAERTSSSPVEARGATLTRIGAVASALIMAGSIAAALVLGRPWNTNAPPVFARVPIGDTGISAELPTALTESANVEPTSPGVQIFEYGDLLASPFVVEVIVADLSEEVPPESEGAFLEMLRTDMLKSSPKGFTLQGEAKLTRVGDHQAVSAEYTGENILLRKYLLLVAKKTVLVQVFRMDDKALGWGDPASTIAASIQSN